MKLRMLLTLGVTVAVGAILWAADPAAKTHKLQTVSLRKMADSLHAVIAANRQLLAEAQTKRPSDAGQPSHAEMLRQANLRIQQHGAEFSYTLRSLWPIHPSHGPQTEVEQTGLEFVARHPTEVYTTEELLGGRSYFTAVYADRATLASCVECHNAHPRSPRRDFKPDDVMGALVVRIPLEF